MRHLALFICLASLIACSDSSEFIADDLRCQVGTYRMTSGALIDIGLSGANHLRWRTQNGRSGRVQLANDTQIWTGTLGWSDEPHSARITLGDCADDSIRIKGLSGLDGEGLKVRLQVNETRFQSDNVDLAGRLVLPEGNQPVPIVVLVHGSEDYSGREYYYDQRLLPAQGIGVFVYDKRGTGESTGEYSQDFHLLAADAAAAQRQALKMAGDRAASSGYFGGSQGGWVAPLAATLSDADFVIASYGMAEGVLAEDRDEVQLRLRNAGFEAEDLAKAKEITDVTGRLLATNFADGGDDLKRLRAAYQDEPWFEHMAGGVTWEMVSRPLWQFRIGYFFLEAGTSWGYEPLPVLKAIDVPMLWVLAGNDSSAPSAKTREILTELQQAGRPIDVAFFPDTEHGIMRYVENENGERTEVGYAAGYFPLIADWIGNRQLADSYEGAQLSRKGS